MDDMIAEAAQTTTNTEFMTPAVSLEPISKDKRRVEIKSPEVDSPTRPRPGRSSPPTMGGPRSDGAAEPARSRARAGDPPASPPPGCSTDALRIHMELVMKGFEQVLGHQAQQQAESAGKIQKLEASIKVVHDELNADAKENHDKVKTEIFALRTELSNFAECIAQVNTSNVQAIEKIEAIDKKFKEHLDVAFVCIEVKCASLSSALEELDSRLPMRAPPGPVRAPPGVPVHELSPEPKAAEERLSAIEEFVKASFPDGCHCAHVKWLLEEFPKVQKSIWELKARGAAPLSPSATPSAAPGPRMGPSTVGGECPHCSHVDLLMQEWPQLAARLAVLEATARRTAGMPTAEQLPTDAPPLIGSADRQPPAGASYGAGVYGGMGLRTDEAHRRNPEDVNWDRLFDDKVALSSAYAYSGKHGE